MGIHYRKSSFIISNLTQIKAFGLVKYNKLECYKRRILNYNTNNVKLGQCFIIYRKSHACILDC